MRSADQQRSNDDHLDGDDVRTGRRRPSSERSASARQIAGPQRLTKGATAIAAIVSEKSAPHRMSLKNFCLSGPNGGMGSWAGMGFPLAVESESFNAHMQARGFREGGGYDHRDDTFIQGL